MDIAQPTPPTPAQPVPPPPPKKNPGILIGILLLLLGILVGLALDKTTLLSALRIPYLGAVPTPTSIPSPAVVPGEAGTQEGTANWKTYQNEQYGFEIKYPPDFKEQKAKSDELLLSVTKTDRGSSYNFEIYIRKNYKINQIVSKVEEVKEINIGDHLGYEYFYIEGAGISGVALIQLGQDALSINFDCIGNGQNFATPNDRKIYVQDFLDQILSTFKFLGPTSQNDKNLTKEECARQGGLWRKWGLRDLEYCQIPVLDGGKSCTDGSQCSLGYCIATNGTVPGKCQTYKETFGCVKRINNGVVDQIALCAD